MKKRIFSLIVCIILISVAAFGQQTEAERVQQEQQRAANESRIREQERRMHEQTEKVFRDESIRRGVYRGKQPSKNEIREKREETKAARERIELLRAPNPEDLVKYKNFLSQPKTGLFRLFPDLGCESNSQVRIDGDCVNAIAYSWSYSFRQNDYSNDLLFDIRLKDGSLISDGFHLQGILVDLGDIPLGSISAADEGIKFLIEFKPETRFEDIRKQFIQIEKGIVSNNYFYAKNVKVRENTTYAARFIAYKRQNDLRSLFRNGESHIENTYFSLNIDKRTDLTMTFRVVRKDVDGNITILWKELNHQSSPKLVFRKDVKLSDIKPEK